MMNGTVVDSQKKPKLQETTVKCPIDNETFKTAEELSHHVDQVHIGPGVLQAYGHKSIVTTKKEKPR